jgi:hypothetical protein
MHIINKGLVTLEAAVVLPLNTTERGDQHQV